MGNPSFFLNPENNAIIFSYKEKEMKKTRRFSINQDSDRIRGRPESKTLEMTQNEFLGNFCKNVNSSETKVTFRKIEDLSNLWIWVEFTEYPIEIDKENFEDAIKAFFITGKLGGYNSLNLQTFFAGEIELSFYKYNNKDFNRIMPSCFHELGAIEFKGSWA